MNNPKILVVDDDPDLLHLIGIRLSVAGYEVTQAASGEEAMERFHSARPQAVITDLRMSGMDGHALFQRLHEEAPTVPVIILTAHGTIPDAVAATQRGVFSFLTKPFDGHELLDRVAAAVAVSPPVMAAGEDGRWRTGIVSVSVVMDELLRQARRASEDNRPLLISGPTGAGKATLAKAIHCISPRAGKPFVVAPSATLPTAELEAQLFGVNGEKQLTGVVALGPLMQAVKGGSLFIDEVGALSPVAQARLLPLVHSAAEVFGRSRSGMPDVRIIAASAMALDRAVRDGSFRADLYYALGAANLRVPALAERQEDIPALVASFVARHGGERRFSPEAIALMQEAPWPGNVRQLENIVEQALRLSVTPLVPATLVRRLLREEQERNMSGFDEARRAFERDYLAQLLQTTAGNVARAARLAQRNRTEFYKLLARHGLDPASFK
jgi:two-component system, NtrC family, response regulator GlrR